MNFRRGSAFVIIIAVAGMIALGAGLTLHSVFDKKTSEDKNRVFSSASQDRGNLNLVTTKLATIPNDLFKLINRKTQSGCFDSFCWPFHAVFNSTGNFLVYTVYQDNKLYVFENDVSKGVYDIPEAEYDENDWFGVPAAVFVSPDGRRIAHFASRPRVMSSADRDELRRENEACENEKKSTPIQKDSGLQELPSAFDEDLIEAFSLHCERAKELSEMKSKPRWFAVIDGTEGEEYDKVDRFIWSDDGEHFAYSATNIGRELSFDTYDSRIVRDGVELESYNEVTSLRFLPGTDKLVYLGWNNRFVNGIGSVAEEVLIVGDKKSDVYNHIDPPEISKDGKVIAFRGDKKEDKKFKKDSDDCGSVITVWGWGEDAVTFPGNCGGIGSMTEDGSAIAYGLREGKDWKYFIRRRDGSVTSVDWDFVTFSPDGKHYALDRKTQDKKFKSYVVVDGKAGKQYDFIYDRILFSPDSSKTAYVAVNGDPVGSQDRFVVVNEEEQPQRFGNVIYWSLQFSPDSKRLAYIASNKLIQPSSPVQTSKPESEFEELPDFDDLDFGEDDLRQSYNHFVVVDGRPGKSYSGSLGNPIFSPDSAHVAYQVNDEKTHQSFLVVDGNENTAYDQILTDIKFSSDSSKILYGARKGNELWWIADDIK